MGRLLLGMTEYILIGACFSAPVLFFLSLAALLRFLPSLLALGARGLRGFFILSVRFYHLLLVRVAPFLHRRLGIDVLNGFTRLLATLLLSLVLGLSMLVLASFPVNEWSVGLLIIHGLLVGLIWDEIEEPRGLKLGVKI